jgi:hypothetical protein
MTPAELAVLQGLNSEPPTIREELERKVTEEVERVILAVRAGKMSTYGYHQALEGLWGGVAGLVSKESMELITEARRAHTAAPNMTLRSVIVIGEAVAVVKWTVGSDTVETMVKKPGTPPTLVARKVEDGSALTALRYYAEANKKFRGMPGAQEF